MLYQRPDLLHHILTVNTDAVIAYLNAQIEAGAQAVMVFDTWGGALSHAAFHEFSLAYTARIIAGLKREYDGGRCRALSSPRAAADGWKVSPPSVAMRSASTGPLISARRGARGRALRCRETWILRLLPSTPKAYNAKPVRFSIATARGSGHVFNLGHGISQHTPPENVSALIEAVRGFERQLPLKTRASSGFAGRRPPQTYAQQGFAGSRLTQHCGISVMMVL